MVTLTGFSNLSTREHHHQVQKNTLDFGSPCDHQNGLNLPLWWWLSSNTPLPHTSRWGPWVPPHTHKGTSTQCRFYIGRHRHDLHTEFITYKFRAFVFMYGADRLRGIADELKISFQSPAGSTSAWRREEERCSCSEVSELPPEELTASLWYLHVNRSRGMFCRWCVGRG